MNIIVIMIRDNRSWEMNFLKYLDFSTMTSLTEMTKFGNSYDQAKSKKLKITTSGWRWFTEAELIPRLSDGT